MSLTEGFARPDVALDIPTLQSGEHPLMPPPELPKRMPVKLIQILLPVVMLLMMVGMVAMMVSMSKAAGQSFNPYQLIFPLFMVVSVLGMAGNSIGGVGNQVSEVNEERNDYLRYLGTQRHLVTETGRAQHAAREWNHPEPEVLPSLVHSHSPRMWERQPGSPQFMNARVGLGTEQLSKVLQPPKTAEIDVLEPVSARFLRRFVDTHKTQSSMPLAIAMRSYPYITLANRSEPGQAEALVRSMITQLCTFHSSDNLLVVVITDQPDWPTWRWVKWLPHNQHPTARDRLGSSRMVYPDVATAREALGELISGRKHHRGKDGGSDANPHFVIIADCAGSATPAAALLGADGVDGVTLIDVHPPASHREGLVRPFELVLQDGFLWAPIEKGPPRRFARPDAVSVRFAADLARMLSAYRPASELDQIASQKVASRGPKKVGLTAHLGISDAAQANPVELQAKRPHRDFMRVLLGLTPDGDRLYLDMKEPGEGGVGPHGLMIGSTGSGKSETLRTLLVSLAATHSSEILNMLLIDYKGGAAFLGFEALPHVSAILTNLADEAHLVTRMDVALRGEINRRMEVFRAAATRPDVHTAVGNITVYNQLRDSGVPLEPLPLLFVVVDEFSALLAEHPEFIELFALIGKLGRSLGINLLLSSQELAQGRIEPIKTHIGYRITLRTNDVRESRDVIGTGDAAELPDTPGAAYLRPGAADLIRWHAFYTGDAYVPPARDEAEIVEVSKAVTDRALVQLFTASSTAPPAGADAGGAPQATAGDGEPDPMTAPRGQVTGINTKTVAMVLVDRLAGHGPEAHRIWLPPLHETYTLHQLYSDKSLHYPNDKRGVLRIPVGLVDNPYFQRRDALVLDLQAQNVGIVGTQGAGTSTLVQSLIMSAAHTHSARDLQFYCLDFGNAKLAMLKDLAHVGCVAAKHQTALVSRTIAELTALKQRREKLFLQHGIQGMPDFRRLKAQGDPRLAQDQHGDVVLVIDGWSTVTQDEAAGLDHLEGAIGVLADTGKGFGIHVVMTSSRHLDYKQKLKESLGLKVELKLGDPSTSEVNRRAAEQLFKTPRPGRGILKSGRTGANDFFDPEVLDLLVALPHLTGGRAPEPLSPDIFVDFRDSIRMINDRNPVHAPDIRLLPEDMSRDEFMARFDPEELAATKARLHDAGRPMLRVPLGLGEDEMLPLYVDFNDDTSTHFAVVADTVKGKTTFLRHLIMTLCENNSPAELQMLVVDSRRRLLGVMPEGYGYHVSTLEALNNYLGALLPQIADRNPPDNVTGAALRRREWLRGRPEIFIIVDNAHEFGQSGQIDPLLPLKPLLTSGRDTGMHFVGTWRSGQVSRQLYAGGILTELKNLRTPGIVMSGSKEEGKILFEQKAAAQPAGRGFYVISDDCAELIQVPNAPDFD